MLYEPDYGPTQVAAQLSELLAERKRNGNGGAVARRRRAAGPIPLRRRRAAPHRAQAAVHRRRNLRKQVVRGEQQVLQPWHLRRAAEVLDFFGCDPETGLSAGRPTGKAEAVRSQYPARIRPPIGMVHICRAVQILARGAPRRGRGHFRGYGRGGGCDSDHERRGHQRRDRLRDGERVREDHQFLKEPRPAERPGPQGRAGLFPSASRTWSRATFWCSDPVVMLPRTPGSSRPST